jgi:hypothetical protein
MLFESHFHLPLDCFRDPPVRPSDLLSNREAPIAAQVAIDYTKFFPSRCNFAETAMA